MPSLVRRTRISRLVTVAAVLAVGVASTACKDDSTAPKVMVAATDATVAVNGTVTSALAGTTFNFEGGAGALAPAVANQNLALSFGGTATVPTADMVITSPTGATVGTLGANVTFGSCIFAVTRSSFPAGHALALGQTITVNPCNLSMNTKGAVANGQATSRSVALLLGTAASIGATVQVAVNAGGQIVLNGNTVGTVSLTPISG
ncbi:MAG: hypothetical protein Q8K55_16215 [Gemmatimonadaceae bacterium]|nr:hypothetical protein [Gemmatimonadaceae bacterium]